MPKKKWNSLKKEILNFLEKSGWITAPLLKELTGNTYPLSGYLEHLRKWRLVLRRGWSSRPIYWRISAKGRDRLAWLRSGEGKRSGR